MNAAVVDRIGNYRVERERSRDATGVVYEARHFVLPRRAIIKIMHGPELEPAASAAVALLREACILEALEHPGVIRVFESGMVDKRPWFAHERVEGATIDDLLANGPLEPAHATAMLRDVAEILEHAHRRGVVHSCIHPERIVVTGRTRGFPICISDWRDARIHDTSAPPRVQGPIEYVAPEVVDGDTLDDRADVFALGVIAYRALTGLLPFDGEWVATVDDGTIQHVPTEVRCPEAPPELTTLVDQMLAWDRWDRPSSAEARAAFESLANDLADDAPREHGVVRIRKPKWTPSLPYQERDDDSSAIRTAEDPEPSS